MVRPSAPFPPSRPPLIHSSSSSLPPSLRLIFIQIRFFLLQNRQGKTRLTKWYLTPPEENDRIKMESDIHRSIVARDKKHTNFVEVSGNFSVRSFSPLLTCSPPSHCSMKISKLFIGVTLVYSSSLVLMRQTTNFC
jgi:hypothetical protein